MHCIRKVDKELTSTNGPWFFDEFDHPTAHLPSEKPCIANFKQFSPRPPWGSLSTQKNRSIVMTSSLLSQRKTFSSSRSVPPSQNWPYPRAILLPSQNWASVRTSGKRPLISWQSLLASTQLVGPSSCKWTKIKNNNEVNVNKERTVFKSSFKTINKLPNWHWSPTKPTGHSHSSLTSDPPFWQPSGWVRHSALKSAY